MIPFLGLHFLNYQMGHRILADYLLLSVLFPSPPSVSLLLTMSLVALGASHDEKVTRVPVPVGAPASEGPGLRGT